MTEAGGRERGVKIFSGNVKFEKDFGIKRTEYKIVLGM